MTTSTTAPRAPLEGKARKPMGGAGKGQGRKPLSEGVESVFVSVRCTPEQKAKFHELGGPAWVRRAIDRAKLPKGV